MIPSMTVFSAKLVIFQDDPYQFYIRKRNPAHLLGVPVVERNQTDGMACFDRRFYRNPSKSTSLYVSQKPTASTAACGWLHSELWILPSAKCIINDWPVSGQTWNRDVNNPKIYHLTACMPVAIIGAQPPWFRHHQKIEASRESISGPGFHSCEKDQSFWTTG